MTRKHEANNAKIGMRIPNYKSLNRSDSGPWGSHRNWTAVLVVRVFFSNVEIPAN